MKKILLLGALIALAVSAIAATDNFNVTINNDTNTAYYCKPMLNGISGAWSNGWQFIRIGTNVISGNFSVAQSSAQLFINCHPDPQKMIAFSNKHWVNLYATFQKGSINPTVTCNTQISGKCIAEGLPNFAQFVIY